MVSPLWKACSEGSLENVVELLRDATPLDIEVKDHTGATPLIEAVKSGHVEIVRVLLDKGADPTNASSQGPPESYTADPVIHGLIGVARSKMAHAAAQPQEVAYPHDQSTESANMDPSTGYYPPPPPGGYYYPPMPPPMMPDGSVPYYAPPPMADSFGNLPPPEIARMIPCRYFPACRYGASCMFAHPQAPYMQGPPPPQYPAPYDPMNPGPYPPPTYYPVPPTSYGASPNDVVSPIQGPFSPVNGQPPMPFGVSPVSPTYGHPGPMPGQVPPLSPLQTHPANGQSPPPHGMYPPISPSAQGMVSPYAMPTQYPPQGMPNGEVADVVSPKSPVHGHPQGEGYGPGPMNREAMTHHRRGSARRPSFGGRGGKPPCLFFPSGRCRNGDDCRFPHVIPEGPMGHQPSHFAPRGGPRPRPPFHAHVVPALEDKFVALTTQDDKGQAHSRNGTGGTTTSDSSRSHSADPGQKGRAPNFRPNGNQFANGPRPDRKFAPPKAQRVPNADEFPVLGGSSPTSRGPSVNGSVTSAYSGPTAAQVLQAPAPPRKDAPTTRGNSPDQASPVLAPKEVAPETNGIVSSPPVESINKLPLSFAAAATAVPETIKEVSVSA